MYNIQFDPEKHVYTVDGEVVPSVTELCAPLGADYDELNDDFFELAIDAATERGTIMHSYIEHRLNGGDREEFEMPSAYQTYADGVELFLAEHDVTPYSIEKPIATDIFAGTPDLTCAFDGEDSVLDWKFVSSVAKSKVAAQLGGYRRILETYGFYPIRLCAVQFLPGTYRLYNVDPDFALRAFELMLEVNAIKTMKHPRGRIGE